MRGLEMAIKNLPLFINGKYTHAKSRETFTSVNPANGRVVAHVAQGGVVDTKRAITAAGRAFPAWAGKSGAERGKIILKATEILRRRVREFARWETLDAGKCISDTINGDLAIGLDFLEWYGTVSLEFPAETIPIGNPNQIDFTLRQPYGVVGLISPWNFPLVTAILKIGPALAVGNTAIMKPASCTPITTLMLGEVFAEAGLPPGVLNIVAGGGIQVGETICGDPRVKKIFFTGSTEVGQRIMKIAADNVTDTSMELGGKSANIIFADADWSQAVAGAAFGSMWNNGQNCICGSRLLVEKKIYKRFLTDLTARFKSLRVGNPLEKTTQLGPLVSQSHYNTVMKYIEIGKQEGAKLMCGGKHPRNKKLANGCYIEPTIFADVSNKMRIAQEEIFGPVVVVIPFADEEHAVQIANDTVFGLGNGIFTTNLAKAHRVMRRLESGTVYVNTYNMVYPQAPFPSWKQSGNTVERGHHGLLENTRYKNVIMDISDQPILWT